MFRLAAYHRLLTRVIKAFELKRTGFSTLVPFIDSISRSDVGNITNRSVVGLELNPKAKRKDIQLESFNNMPIAWKDKFFILYTNSFDHSYDPYLTAEEMKRVCCNGGYIILAFPEAQQPDELNAVGCLDIDDAKGLFGNEVIYYNYYGSRWNYTEYIIRINKE